MKITDAIARCDLIYPNSVDSSEKKRLLSQLDGRVKTDIFDKYETADGEGFSGYTDSTSEETVLLIPFPFDNIYASWLVAHMYLYMEEHDKYNDWLTIFNSEWDSYERYYAQNHHQNTPDHFIYL